MQHVMLDLETLGTSAGCIILSIGAITFNENTVTNNKFYTVIDKDSCVDLGLRSDVSTRLWWSEQTSEAKQIFNSATKTNIIKAIQHFAGWMIHNFNKDETLIYANGASFDFAILVEAFRRVGLERPWHFWNERCFRTIKSIFPIEPPKRSGTAHNALDDAVYQAEWLIEIVKQTGIKLK